ncbi:hypothetical protein TPHA_0C01230 [Tetrapisispora phaffii CBS 4417]|uniref:BAR domain-containing protein n=1 Tax=Tetrapisispora phaffii (strain ATCC 24235 / CBS 4417 / NBRC 1672 / NRRL Y-8282 / UCD 70-5) TaxID=1071381 RepID=G8BRA3_TETPH|nr:hypothetical protein TPHA_0C01230 [Tetrapisispora phaffii CBS 4417]CCE62279.1 hypothetical protein TPHA_0C01230 [Tetrapisispora phaffii CBS 4417]
MSFNDFASSLTQKFQELSTVVSERTQDLGTSIPSIASSTQRLVQEKLGNVTDISQLPQEYLELEKEIDTIKLVYEHFLKITSIYDNESYDYPKYVSDSVNDYSKLFQSKIEDLSRATSAEEAQNILVTPGPITEPRTLNYALSKVALTSSESLNQLQDPNVSAVASTLLKFSDMQTKIAQQRLQQDTLIQTKVNKVIKEKLSSLIEKATKSRRDVQYKRLQYDVARSKLAQAKPEKEAALRVEMESLEEQFAQATESATVTMQDVISQSKFLDTLKNLVEAQLSYFENSANLLKELLPEFESSSA